MHLLRSVSRQHQPPSMERVNSKFSREEMGAFAEELSGISPNER
jgi:hypothetical protein